MNVLRWSARISGALLAVVVVAFLFGESERLQHPDPVEAVQMAFFLVMVAGWVVGWLRERIGGWMTVAGFGGFQAVEWGGGGGLVLDPQFLVMLVPGLLFLAAARSRE